MNEVKRIKQNSIYSLFSISSRLIANVFIFLLIPRFYEPDVFGQFTFAHTLSNTLIILADFGFDILLTIEIARNKDGASKIFQQYFTLKAIFSFSAMIVMWILAFAFNVTDSSRNLIIVFSLFLLFTALTNFFYALFKGLEKFEYETSVSLIMNIFLLMLTIFLMYLRVNVILLASGFVLSRLIGFLLGFFYAKRVLPNIKLRPIVEGLSNIKNNMFVFGFHLFFSYLFFQLDTILLALWKGEYFVGIYQSAFKLIMLPLIIPEILINVLLPVLSRMFKENKSMWELTGSYLNKVLLIIAIPITIILFVYAEPILSLIYGARYNDAVLVLKIFSLIIFIRFTLEPYALMLTTSNRQIVRLYAVIAATILNFFLNSFAIKQYGIYGAAIVSLITNLTVALLYIYTEFSLFKQWSVNLSSVILFLFTTIIFVLFYFFIDINFLIGASLIIIIYLLYGYFFYFTKEEKNIILSDFSFLRLFIK